MMRRIEDRIVLVIDDDDMNLQVAKMVLERKVKCRVLTALSGKEGLEILRSQDVSLVLLDIMMPDFDGIATLQEIRSDELLSEMPVMMLTASGDVEDIKKSASLGVKDYIKKPFMPTELIERVTKKLLAIDDEELEKILLVGDDKVDFRLTRRVLEEKFAYEVLLVSSVEAAIEFLHNNEVSLIMVSSEMKFIAGFRLLSFIASDERLKEIPVVLTTDNALFKSFAKLSPDIASDTSIVSAIVEVAEIDSHCAVTVDVSKLVEPVTNFLGEHFDVGV